MRLTLTDSGEALLMEALAIYNGLIEQVMSQSSPAECDRMGAMMQRITEAMKVE